MVKEVVISKIPDSFLENQIGDEGVSGRCFLVGKNKAFKQYTGIISKASKIKEIASKYKSSYVCFPEILYYYDSIDDDNFCGYIMPYAKGNDISKLDSNFDYIKFLEYLTEIENEVKRLSLDNLGMFDMSEYNILYDENEGFKIIDTDFYHILFNAKECLETNFNQLSRTFLYPFVPDANSLYNSNNYTISEILNIIDSTLINGKLKPSEMLYSISSLIQNETYEDINTIGDFKKQFELIRHK